MPELPEVETVARALAECVVSRRIVRVELFSPKMRESLLPLLDAKLEESLIVGIRRRGRYLIMELDGQRALLMHLGMSGVIRVESDAVAKRKHEHLFLHLDDGNIFRFECPRRFSLVRFCRLREAGGVVPDLAKLGVEPLEAGFTGELFYRAAQQTAREIKVVLMDNEIVVGVGNIYAAESLFEAGIHPARAARSLTRRECARLVDAVKMILNRAIAAGGSTISDYRKVDGSEGLFARELHVYGRKNQPCHRCGALIESFRQAGRSSFFCPVCQKKG